MLPGLLNQPLEISARIEYATAVLIPTLFTDLISGDLARYSATMMYPFGRHRGVQGSTSITVLKALLPSILVLLTMGRSPSSVGSIAGGDVVVNLYDGGPAPLCWDDVTSRLGKDSKVYLVKNRQILMRSSSNDDLIVGLSSNTGKQKIHTSTYAIKNYAFNHK